MNPLPDRRSPLPNSRLTAITTADISLSGVSPVTGQVPSADLVFVQDSSGRYLSFAWHQGKEYGVVAENIVGRGFDREFLPTSPEAYEQRLQKVLSRGIPEQFHCLFRDRDRLFPFELSLSPILTVTGAPQSVLGMGRWLGDRVIPTTVGSVPPPQSDPDPDPNPDSQRLTEIARNIRSTLSLETIWQQTADSIGAVLGVSRCLMIATDAQQKYLDIKGEYCQKGYAPLLGKRWESKSETCWQQALQQKTSLGIETRSEILPSPSLVIIPTVYQNYCNGLICLQQCDRLRTWSRRELDLVQELADQVGTAIAHATLYQELGQATHAAEEASRLKSEFLASTTHELRTPLNGIIGFLKLVLDGMADDAEEQQQFLEEAHKSALHLLNLINDILDIAKIEAGKMELELSAVPLEELFQSVDSFTRPQAHRKNLNFKTKLPPTLTPIIVYGNYQRLLQVMLNLVGNAIKFTHEGGIIIGAELVKKRVLVHNQSFPGMVKLSVADTGIGVSLEKQSKLFEKFVQVDGSRTKAYGGTGLGLAISQKLVETMGGKVEFYSMGEGLGSTVTFTIPVERMPIVETQISTDSPLDEGESLFDAIEF